MAMMIPNDTERPLDIPKCVMVSFSGSYIGAPFRSLMRCPPADVALQMALVHDLAEAQ